MKVGAEGVVTVEEGQGRSKRELDVVEGMQFDRGYLSPYFVTDSERWKPSFRGRLDSYVHEKKISNMKRSSPGARAGCQDRQAARHHRRGHRRSEALATLVVNKLAARCNIAAVKAPGFGDRRKEMLRTSRSSPVASASPRTSV